MPKKLKKRSSVRCDFLRLHCLIFAGLALLFFLSLFFLKRFSHQVYEQRKQLKLLRLQNERLKQLPQEIQSWQKEIDLLREFFPDKEGVISFLNFLEKIAPQQEIKISFENQKSQQVIVDALGRPFLRFSLTVEDDWQTEVVPFLKALIAGPYFVFPENLSLESSDDIFHTTKLSLSARIYVDQDFFERSP